MGLFSSAGPFRALGDLSLDRFVEKIAKGKETLTLIENYIPPEKPSPKRLVKKRWIVNNLLIEAKRAVRRRATAISDLDKLKIQSGNAKIKALKNTTTSDVYSDKFDKLVCQLADKNGISLPEAEKVIRTKIETEVDDNTISAYLTENYIERKKKILERFIKRGLQIFGNNIETALTFATIMFQIDQRKTDKTWGKIQPIVVEGLNGKPINLLTVLCTINEFDNAGGYKLNPELDAYKYNPKLEPIPLIVDELLLVQQFFASFNINTKLTIFVADTDFTEIEQWGKPNQNNLGSLEIYIKNLRKYVKNTDNTEVLSISEITNNSTLYQKIKSRIFELTGKFTDYEFRNKWYKKFEASVEGMSDALSKRGLYDKPGMSAINLIRKIWSVNAAQGAVLSELENAILVSTERRERDQNYALDKNTAKKLLPIIYILRAAESWNRKLTPKDSN